MVAISSLFTTSNIAGIQFPLHAGSSPPLHFRPLEDLVGIRKSSASSTTTSRTIARNTPTPPIIIHELVTTPGALSETVDELLTTTREQAGGRHPSAFGQIALALLLLGYGYTDECHNLITPLSWPDDIHFAAGPSVYHQTPTDARAMATYVHCLVHRREAFNVGEFGMVGFANANYWSSAVVKQSSSSEPQISDILPHEEWHAQVVELASQPEYINCPSIQNWCQSHGFVKKGADTSLLFFESRAIHELCATVLRTEEERDGNNNRSDNHHGSLVKAFAEQVVASEIRILLGKALERAGIEVTPSSTRSSTTIGNNQDESSTNSRIVRNTSNGYRVLANEESAVDEGMAIRAMKSISSAHLDNFLVDGFIVLRRVAILAGDADGSDTAAKKILSAAAGIACRLLQAPACQLREDDSLQNPGIGLFLPATLEAAEELAQRIGRPHDLSIGDCFVVRLSPGQTGDKALQEVAGVHSWELELCSRDNNTADAIFVDPLFGSRGETPTTVIQWSKGTIF